MIRKVQTRDIPAITNIYNTYITNTCITFETEPVTEKEMERRMKTFIGNHYPYLVYEENGEIVGYCYAHAWKEKQAYNHTAETTIYLHPGHTGKGIGSLLMKELIGICRSAGLHALIACITVPNEASVRLHLSLGFRQVSHFTEVGKKFGKWLDVADYQLLL